jgi:formylglycine-generating enzyme required for sulfatase activity
MRIVARSLLAALILPPLTSAATEPPPAPRVFTNSIGMSFAQIPAGEFMMGAADSDPAAAKDEKPQHRVRIGKDFCLAMHEVTQDQYARVMGTESLAKRRRIALMVTRSFSVSQPSGVLPEAIAKEIAVLDGVEAVAPRLVDVVAIEDLGINNVGLPQNLWVRTGLVSTSDVRFLRDSRANE